MINGELKLNHTIRWAMVGGGRGSQIGYIHRSSALRDNTFQLVAGAFDIDPLRGKEFGVGLGLDEERCYPDYKTMFKEEAKRSDGIEAVSIATPNGTHFEICKAALEAKLHVVCEKPMCFSTKEAAVLKELSEKNNRVVGITYGYAGHQLIQQARSMVANGDLGEIRVINMQFAFGSYAFPIEQENPAAKWRLDPNFAGPSFAMGDVGTHPLFLSEAICPELKIKRLMCSRQSFVKDRQLEDNAITIMEYENGAVANVWSSAMNCGSVHGQKIRIIGSKASLEWWDERPNQLTYEVEGKPVQILERGGGYLYEEAREEDRISCGHPEGLFEAWTNLYLRFAMAMDRIDSGKNIERKDFWYPDVEAGYQGVKWVEKCVESADNDSKWVEY
ncbi:Gfo/Idh/MocA family protein [Anaerosacchariphilus polymeriproducens]|uniref:Gfo/Idh/MocA family oxidoreductase n=1 Tax=Anaerosacchariphilus polymeriproducens TaxID=1812858 RepID=A0A371ARY9_9FIRM|nr:Gfo/Idh/MocA family oxidoreductase [Anaerosacchariphilus polymeriproducens]RDU22351.1 gfo/Idh/MocA family oxidoreductase [Anaerosacchariphilus polymeriproducens]